MHPDATTVTIYTDGSGIENKIGAAAYNSSTNEVSHQYLGSEAQFNVYTAELTAIHLAVKQLWNHSEHLTGRIYTDSQAAAKAIIRPPTKAIRPDHHQRYPREHRRNCE